MVATSRVSRRRFVQGAGGAVGLIASAQRVWGVGAPRELSGTQFDLEIGSLAVNFTGRPRLATVVNGQLPAPLLRWRQGDLITLRVTNRLPVRTSIHWHGLILPANMDGVPGLSFGGIDAGASFHLPVSRPAVGHLLVPQPFALPGANRALRPDRHRAGGR